MLAVSSVSYAQTMCGGTETYPVLFCIFYAWNVNCMFVCTCVSCVYETERAWAIKGVFISRQQWVLLRETACYFPPPAPRPFRLTCSRSNTLPLPLLTIQRRNCWVNCGFARRPASEKINLGSFNLALTFNPCLFGQREIRLINWRWTASFWRDPRFTFS